MSVEKKDVEYIAKLARLNVTDETSEAYQKQLSLMLDYVDKLNEVNTDNVETTDHIVSNEDVLRLDKTEESMDIGKLLENSPGSDSNFFQIPKII